jgi:hypothetical protein
MKQYEMGRQTCIIQDGTACNLKIFTQNVFKFVHVIPTLYVMHLEKIHILYSAKCGA